ncbi:hypothetical protein TWF481_001158 [Arthrobotrys musiformis]|uniref:MYND-type domain-containing protein n=1 Tax=Arthrobotrys musiformis TaxID=47236 RepID=A0AAV9WPP8_9PEZI
MDVRTRFAEDVCYVCGCKTNRCCKGCRSVFYCSEAHRQKHWEDHTEACLEIRAAVTNLKEAEDTFIGRNRPEYRNLRGILADMERGKAPGPEVECFCTVFCSPVMMARFNLITAYHQVNSHRGTVNACNTAITTQFLGKCDPMKIRCITANLLVRVGSKQNAYDFIRFWLINGDKYRCQGTNPKPFIPLRNTDAFEPCRRLIKPFKKASVSPPASFLVPLALLKFKLLIDIKNLRNLQLLRTKLPFDVVHMIKKYFYTTDIMKRRHDISRIDTLRGYERVIKKLEKDLDTLFEICGQAFEGRYVVWRCFFEQDPKNQARRYSKEVQKIYNYSADAWMETPGGYEWILKKLGEACDRELFGEDRIKAAAQVAHFERELRSKSDRMDDMSVDSSEFEEEDDADSDIPYFESEDYKESLYESLSESFDFGFGYP